MSEVPDHRLHLNLETLKFFDPLHFLSLLKANVLKKLHQNSRCLKWWTSGLSWEAHTIFHPFPNIGVPLNIHCPKPGQ
jgi:hypothetical protein